MSATTSAHLPERVYSKTVLTGELFGFPRSCLTYPLTPLVRTEGSGTFRLNPIFCNTLCRSGNPPWTLGFERDRPRPDGNPSRLSSHPETTRRIWMTRTATTHLPLPSRESAGVRGSRPQRESSSASRTKVSTGQNGSGLRAKILQHPCLDQGAHCRPLDPASLSLVAGKKRPCITDGKKPLTQLDAPTAS